MKAEGPAGTTRHAPGPAQTIGHDGTMGAQGTAGAAGPTLGAAGPPGASRGAQGTAGPALGAQGTAGPALGASRGAPQWSGSILGNGLCPDTALKKGYESGPYDGQHGCANRRSKRT